MKWEEIIGQKPIKKHLQDSISENRVSHAQLLIGKSGYGTLALALAYASQILCDTSENCYAKTAHLQHPDLHLVFPTINKDKTKALSVNYIKEFREFVIQNPYADLMQWYEFLEEDKKQGIISVEEIEEIIYKLNMKSFEGGYKIQIIWMAEKMNIPAANKLLKMLEEPPAKTLFLLIVEEEDKLLQTIISRCQSLKIPRIETKEIEQKLTEKYSLDFENAQQIAKKSEGNWNEALKNVNTDQLQEEFQKYFIEWNRAAFASIKNTTYLGKTVKWSIEVASWGREKQKNFLDFCAETFRQALLQNYQVQDLVSSPLTYNNFKWEGFSPFVHGNNIEDILKEINEASLHIERNGNPKLIFLDLGIKLTRFLARKKN